jgi:serine phosphatase RsbU (regulator of sigma subunit)
MMKDMVSKAPGPAGSTSPQELLNWLMAGLNLFVGNTPQHDDVTCMLLKA